MLGTELYDECTKFCEEREHIVVLKILFHHRSQPCFSFVYRTLPCISPRNTPIFMRFTRLLFKLGQYLQYPMHPFLFVGIMSKVCTVGRTSKTAQLKQSVYTNDCQLPLKSPAWTATLLVNYSRFSGKPIGIVSLLVVLSCAVRQLSVQCQLCSCLCLLMSNDHYKNQGCYLQIVLINPRSSWALHPHNVGEITPCKNRYIGHAIWHVDLRVPIWVRKARLSGHWHTSVTVVKIQPMTFAEQLTC